MTSAIVTHADGTRSHHRNVVDALTRNTKQAVYVKLLLANGIRKLISNGTAVQLVDDSWLSTDATASQVIAMANSAGFKLVNTLKNGIELRPANHA